MNLRQYLDHAAYCDRMRLTAGDHGTREGYRIAAAGWRQLADLEGANRSGLSSLAEPREGARNAG
jgi:hypothetical protein